MGRTHRSAGRAAACRIPLKRAEPGREVSLKVAALTDWIEHHLPSILLARAAYTANESLSQATTD